MRAAQRRHLFRAAEFEALVLRTECLQRCTQPRAAESRVQISQDAHDGARSAQLSSSRDALGDGAVATREHLRARAWRAPPANDMSKPIDGASGCVVPGGCGGV